MRSHIGWRGERSIPYKGVETSSPQTRFKNLEGKPERESPKKTKSASGGLGPLRIGNSYGSIKSFGLEMSLYHSSLEHIFGYVCLVVNIYLNHLPLLKQRELQHYYWV